MDKSFKFFMYLHSNVFIICDQILSTFWYLLNPQLQQSFTYYALWVSPGFATKVLGQSSWSGYHSILNTHWQSVGLCASLYKGLFPVHTLPLYESYISWIELLVCWQWFLRILERQNYEKIKQNQEDSYGPLFRKK